MRLNLLDEGGRLPPSFKEPLRRVGALCLTLEGVLLPCQATLLITDDARIRTLNRDRRGIDRPTDVLSFPSVLYKKGTARDNARRLKAEMDPESGHAELGDIALSMPRALSQAEEYGHSPLREVCFLFAHGMLHLLGYDHETEKKRAAMRRMEDGIMEKAGLSVNNAPDAEALEMIRLARAAMQSAYAPYSRYRVGACARAADGRLFCGCNVENASFGLTLCAERNAVSTAIFEGARAITAIAIASEGAMPYPCGACRQFLREFAAGEGENMAIYITNETETDITTLSALLPHSFGPESLPKD